MPYDPVGDALRRFRQGEDEPLSLHDRIEARVAQADAAIMGALQRVTQGAAGWLAEYGNRVIDSAFPEGGPETRYTPIGIPYTRPEDPLEAVDMLSPMRALASPMQSIPSFAADVVNIPGMLPGIPDNMGAGLQEAATLPDQIFGSPEEFAETGHNLPLYSQMGSDMLTEMGAIAMSGPMMGGIARGVAPMLGNAPAAIRAPIQLMAAEAPATRLAGVGRDALRYAAPEATLAAVNPKYSTAAMLGEGEDLVAQLEAMPEEDRPAAAQVMASLYENSLGRLPEGLRKFLTDTSIGRAVGELPMTAAFSPFGALDADPVARRMDSWGAVDDAIRYRGGEEMLHPNETRQLDVMRDLETSRMDNMEMMQNLPVYDQRQLPAPLMPDARGSATPIDLSQLSRNPEDLDLLLEPEEAPAPEMADGAFLMPKGPEPEDPLVAALMDPDMVDKVFVKPNVEEPEDPSLAALRAVVPEQDGYRRDRDAARASLRQLINDPNSPAELKETLRGQLQGALGMREDLVGSLMWQLENGPEEVARFADEFEHLVVAKDLMDAADTYYTTGVGSKEIQGLAAVRALHSMDRATMSHWLPSSRQLRDEVLDTLLPRDESVMDDLVFYSPDDGDVNQSSFLGWRGGDIPGRTNLLHPELGPVGSAPPGTKEIVFSQNHSEGQRYVLTLDAEAVEYLAKLESPHDRTLVPHKRFSRILNRVGVEDIGIVRVTPDAMQTKVGREIFGDVPGGRAIMLNQRAYSSRPRYLEVGAGGVPSRVIMRRSDGAPARVQPKGSMIHAPPADETVERLAAAVPSQFAAPDNTEIRGGIFSSRLEDAVEKLASTDTPRGTRGRFPNGTTGENWLRALMRESQISREELRFRGLDRWLEGERWSRPVTPDEVRAFLRGEGALDVEFARFGNANFRPAGVESVDPATRSARLDVRYEEIEDYIEELQGEPIYRHQMEDIRKGFDVLMQSGEFHDLPSGVRFKPSKAFTRGWDAFVPSEVEGIPDVYIGSVNSLRDSFTPAISTLQVQKKLFGAGTMGRGRASRDFGATKYEQYVRDDQDPSSAAEYVLSDPRGRYSDHHWSIVPGGHIAHVRMGSATVAHQGKNMKARIINEIQATAAQEEQKNVANVEEAVRVIRMDLQQHQERLTAERNAPPERYSPEDIAALERTIARKEKDIASYEEDLRVLRRRGTYAAPRRTSLAEDELPSGSDWGEPIPLARSSQFAGAAMVVALHDAIRSTDDLLVVTPGRVAAKFATGVADYVDQVQRVSWDGRVLTAWEAPGYRVGTWVQGRDFQSLSDVVPPDIAAQLRAGVGKRNEYGNLIDNYVDLTVEDLSPPQGGIDKFYDETVIAVTDRILHQVGIDPKSVKTTVTMPATPKDGPRTAVGYRLTQELREAMKSEKVRLMGTAGLATAAALDYELGEDHELNTGLMAMALLGVPGGPRRLKGATSAFEAGARSGVTYAQLGGAIVRVGVGATAGGLVGQAVYDEDPGFGMLAGMLVGGTGGLASANRVLRRARENTNPVLKGLTMSGDTPKLDKFFDDLKKDPKATLSASWTSISEAARSASMAIRQEYFDELAILDHLRLSFKQEITIEEGMQLGPEVDAILDPFQQLTKGPPQELAAGSTQKYLPPADPSMQTIAATDASDYSNAPTAANALRKRDRTDLQQMLHDEANRLLKADPDIEFEVLRTRALEHVLGDAASQLEQLERHARLLRGHRGYGEIMLKRGVMAPGESKPRTRGFLSVLEDLGDKQAEFKIYAIGRRVRHLENTGRASLVPEQYRPGTTERKELEKYLAKADEDVVRAFDEVQEINRASIRLLEEEGVIAPGSAEKILASVGDDYIPFTRDVEYGTREGLLSRAVSMTKKERTVQQMTGSKEQLPLMDPVESFARLQYRFANAIFRQRAADSLAKVVPHLDPSQVRKVRPSDILESAKLRVDQMRNLTAKQREELQTLINRWELRDEIADRVGKENVEQMLEELRRATGLDEDALARHLPDGTLDVDVPRFRDGDNIIRVYDEDGVAQYYKVLDKDIWDAVHGADPFEVQGVVGTAVYKSMIAPARWLRTFTTSTPQFQLANLFRDTMFAAVASSEKSDNAIFAMTEAFTDALGGLAVTATSATSRPGRVFGGASLGAIGGSAANYDSEDKLGSIARGAAVGATAGMAGGAVLEPIAKGYLRGTGLDAEEVMNMFSNIGAQQAAFQSIDLKNIGKSIADHIDAARAGTTDIEGKLRHPVRAAMHMHPFEALRQLGIAAENANRVGEFTRSIKNMKKAEAGVTRSGLEKGGAGARDVTVDFSRKGSAQAVQALRPIAAFWGAGMQSMDKLRRLAVSNPKRLAMVGSVGITAPSLALYAMNRDDPEYWDLPKWQRVATWPIPRRLFPGMGDEGFILVPKPFEIGVIFGSLPEAIMEHFDRRNGLFERIGMEPQNPENEFFGDGGISNVVVDEFLKGVVDNLVPDVTSIQPFIENALNKDFTGLSIVSPWDMANEMPDYLRGYEESSQFARWLGRLADVSPAQIDNVVQGWTGTMGRQTVIGADRFFRDEETVGPSPALGQEDRFVVRRFMSDPTPSSTPALSSFYEKMNEADALFMELNKMEDVGLLEDAKAKYQEPKNKQLIESRQWFRQHADSIGSLREMRNGAEASPDLDPQEKKAWIDYYNALINRVAKEAVDWGGSS